ncbi:ATP-binding cassette domain-containing protein, partial [Klebsiella pneumoniae]|uniref:ATP-binding cassette domain-containing protein n=1 Tax=Klebsiella pneumoniae TaxID=573 RepID=UPI001952F5EF
EVLPGRKARCWVTQGGETLALKQRLAATPAGTTQRQGPKRAEAPILRVRGLVKHFALPKSGFFEPYRYVHAVDHVDLDVFKGETVGLVGESGCGKSTLARVVMRIHQPSAGEISFDGTDIAQAK